MRVSSGAVAGAASVIGVATSVSVSVPRGAETGVSEVEVVNDFSYLVFGATHARV